MTDRARRFPVGLTIAVAISLAILVGLGSWQLKRLAWKEGLLARVAALQAAPAKPGVAAMEQMSVGADLDFARVQLECPGLASAPYVQLYSVRDGQPGARLVSACHIAGGRYRSILVDRGFVDETVSARPRVNVSDRTPITITGVLRVPEPGNFVSPPNDVAANRWYVRDVPAMAKALSADAPAPLVLMAETSSNPEWKALDPAPLPAEISNRHLEYALTWFGLAASLVGVYVAMLWRRRKT
ncbi:MAG: SURF1 family cytochrome oxidase biogenesis protein [Pseudomonadota bacterium]|uniref:SURF1 family protein n=1 Tax=Phenylobacterium sp. TaxID=1871053 RepID=UPI0025E3A7E1|nr:SURF1 family cytochrome oxidase biogenesis protein [Phenylobacterium sp.]MBT9471182.1 SURF1 family protein [Phenylobacterium sp.]